MEEKEKNTANLSTAKVYAPVVWEEKPSFVSGAVDPKTLVCSQMKDVCALRSEPLSMPSPQAIKMTATVSAVSAIGPVPVEEKPSDVTGVVLVDVEQKYSVVCTQLDADRLL